MGSSPTWAANKFVNTICLRKSNQIVFFKEVFMNNKVVIGIMPTRKGHDTEDYFLEQAVFVHNYANQLIMQLKPINPC